MFFAALPLTVAGRVALLYVWWRSRIAADDPFVQPAPSGGESPGDGSAQTAALGPPSCPEPAPHRPGQPITEELLKGLFPLTEDCDPEGLRALGLERKAELHPAGSLLPSRGDVEEAALYLLVGTVIPEPEQGRAPVLTGGTDQSNRCGAFSGLCRRLSGRLVYGTGCRCRASLAARAPGAPPVAGQGLSGRTGADSRAGGAGRLAHYLGPSRMAQLPSLATLPAFAKARGRSRRRSFP